jgi:hypothetical protein
LKAMTKKEKERNGTDRQNRNSENDRKDVISFSHSPDKERDREKSIKKERLT